jgi:hypothetical protein
MPWYDPHANANRVAVKKEPAVSDTRVKKEEPSSSGRTKTEPVNVENESPSSSVTVKKEHPSKARRTQLLGSSQNAGPSTRGRKSLVPKMEPTTANTEVVQNPQQNAGLALASSNRSLVAATQHQVEKKTVNLPERLSKSQRKREKLDKRAQGLFPGLGLEEARRKYKQVNRENRDKRAQELFPGLELEEARRKHKKLNRKAHRKKSNDSWKYSLVRSKSERDAITAKVRAKNNLEEVSAPCTTS